MPIRLLIKNDHAFTPEDIERIVTAYEDALRTLKLADRDDPATLLVAQAILDLAKQGERDPARLRDGALSTIRT